MVLSILVFAGVVHATAVTEGFEETAVTRIAGVAAGQVMAQAGLLMRDTAAGGACASSLQPYSLTQILWVWQQYETKILQHNFYSAQTFQTKYHVQ